MNKYVREGRKLVRRETGGTYTLELPDPVGFTVGYWIEPSPFENTPPWEWVITNMPVTVVTGMSAGYTFTKNEAIIAVCHALNFWSSLGYEVAEPPWLPLGGRP